MTNKLMVLEQDGSYYLAVDSELTTRSGGVDYTGGYVVVNSSTGVCEFATAQMPEAKAAMYALNESLANKPWKWTRPVNPDGSPQEVH